MPIFLKKSIGFFENFVDMLGIEPKECRRTTAIRPVEWTVRDSNPIYAMSCPFKKINHLLSRK